MEAEPSGRERRRLVRTAINESAQEDAISELVGWALPIQERHFADVKDGSLKLAGEKDPYEES